ncbi:MAG: hypothetical protein NTU73_14270 [Ignavibacteriae bacterium]|nr:hypothetical protein [Ignavibacteriota bacterium]
MKLLYKLFPPVFKWNRKAYCLYYHKNGKNIYNAFSINGNKKVVNEYLKDNFSKHHKVLRVSEDGYKSLTEFYVLQKATDTFSDSDLKMQMLPKIGNAFVNYQVGDYLTALKNFNELVYEYNNLYEYLFYYMRRCEHVLSIPLIEGNITSPLMPPELKTQYNRGGFLEVFHSEIDFALDLIKSKYNMKIFRQIKLHTITVYTVKECIRHLHFYGIVLTEEHIVISKVHLKKRNFIKNSKRIMNQTRREKRKKILNR